jgi:dTDP-D-glucose 4,6-dehydratase
MDKPKLLITGGLGFIFSHVTEYFVQKGWEVVVVDNLSEGSHPEIINGSFKHHNVDVSDVGVVEVILKEAPHYVIHAAAISDVDFSIREPRAILEKNILANINMFEACRMLPSLKKYIYVSTDEVYGECDVRKNEHDPMLPRNPYSASKAAGSLLRIAYENTYKHMQGAMAETRFCNVFGPRQDVRKILPIIKESVETGKPVPMFDTGGSYREYIYVKNIPPAIEKILEEGTGIYNVTLNDGYTVKDLIAKAEEVSGKKIATVLSHRPGIDMKYQMDSSRMLALGWLPTYTFERGLKEYLEQK